MMLNKLKQWSSTRTAWLLLTLSVVILEGMALWYQYRLNYQPCVMCIYQRAALLGIMLAGIIGMILPTKRLRLLPIAIWIIAAGMTMHLAWQHTMLQLHPPLFASCDLFARFPSWLPLDQWLPSMFKATGSCLDRSWTLFNYSMPQWLLAFSTIYFVIAILVLLSQLKKDTH